MNYRWCRGCGVLIPDILVFCTEQCGNAFFLVDEKTVLSDQERARLAFVKASLLAGRMQFAEGVLLGAAEEEAVPMG